MRDRCRSSRSVAGRDGFSFVTPSRRSRLAVASDLFPFFPPRNALSLEHGECTLLAGEWGPKQSILIGRYSPGSAWTGHFLWVATGCWRAFLYNYKNRGPFPPGKLNFHHKTSWPQTKKSILDHVIIRDNAVPPEALLPRCRTVQAAITLQIDLQSSSRRSLAWSAHLHLDKYMSKVIFSGPWLFR